MLSLIFSLLNDPNTVLVFYNPILLLLVFYGFYASCRYLAQTMVQSNENLSKISMILALLALSNITFAIVFPIFLHTSG